jgi:hypothetical protein
MAVIVCKYLHINNHRFQNSHNVTPSAFLKWYLPICYNSVSPSDFNSLLMPLYWVISMIFFFEP